MRQRLGLEPVHRDDRPRQHPDVGGQHALGPGLADLTVRTGEADDGRGHGDRDLYHPGDFLHRGEALGRGEEARAGDSAARDALAGDGGLRY